MTNSTQVDQWAGQSHTQMHTAHTRFSVIGPHRRRRRVHPVPLHRAS